MNFKHVSFLDLLETIVDNRGKTCPTAESGIPLIATNCVLNEHLYPIFEKLRYVDDTTYKSWFRGHPIPGDMLFVTKGTPGRVCLVPDPVNFCIAQDMVAIRADSHQIYPKYLFALLRSSAIQKQIENMHVGTMIPHFKKGDFDKLFLPVPLDYNVQMRIGDFYFDLSEKIELNRQTNATLEAMAQAIFKEWFVQNESVDDWEVVPLPEIMDVNPNRTLRRDEIAPYLDMANVPTQGHRAIEWRERAFSSGTKFANGDTLLARITPCLENGKTAFVDFLADGETGWGSTEFIVFRPKPPFPPEYGYYLARSNDVRTHAIQNMVGSSGRQRVPSSSFDNFLLSVPPTELISRFGVIAKSIMIKIAQLDNESRFLAQTRDLLLPKLMSGEVFINDMEV